jgi:hypothetical protein
MAEAFLKKYGGDRFEVEAPVLNKASSVVVDVMRSRDRYFINKTKSILIFTSKGTIRLWLRSAMNLVR